MHRFPLKSEHGGLQKVLHKVKKVIFDHKNAVFEHFSNVCNRVTWMQMLSRACPR